MHAFHYAKYEPTLIKLMMMDDPVPLASEELCDKSEELSQLSELSTVESVRQ